VRGLPNRRRRHDVGVGSTERRAAAQLQRVLRNLSRSRSDG
jgi:hypothetical protein